jgi:hypothetical protein
MRLKPEAAWCMASVGKLKGTNKVLACAVSGSEVHVKMGHEL